MQRRTWLSFAGRAAGLAGLGCLGLSSAPAAAYGRPVRVILVTSGSFRRYRRIFFSVMAGLQTLGLIARMPSGVSGDTGIANATGTDDLWTWLGKNAGGSSLEFLPDGHYDYEFSADKRQTVRTLVAERIATANDVDLILTLGNEATVDMFRQEKRIPILALGTADAIASGLVKSLDDSGQDNLHVGIMVNYFDWQTKTFHAAWPFRRLGLIAATSRWQVSGEPEVRRSCEALGAEFFFQSFVEAADPAKNAQAAKGAILRLIDRGIDALVLPAFSSTDEAFREVVELLEARGIPSFSQSGPELVRRGILLGVAESTFESYGLFEAEVIRRVIEREMPRSIRQTYYQRGRIVVNLYTAMKLGWKPSFGLLASVEEAYPTQSITIG